MNAFLGPAKEEGPLPAVIYFALSEQESLYENPYNQPIKHLETRPLRLFSFTLPAHGPGLKSTEAIAKWAESFSHGSDPLASFLTETTHAIEALFSQGLIAENRLGFMGLSRGGLIAGLIAARLHVMKIPIKAWVGFAPMTELSFAKEFQEFHQKPAKDYSLFQQLPHLAGLPARFYIGNRDTRVSTRRCFEFVEQLTEATFSQGTRSPPVELIVTPSIGSMGHGTSKESFCSGADWIATQLGVIPFPKNKDTFGNAKAHGIQ